MPPDNNEMYFLALRLVENHSKSLNTCSWIWGGLVIDAYENRLLREHDDIDYLTLNLHSLLPEFVSLFGNDGWQTTRLSNGDLKVYSAGVKIHLGHVEILDRARWTHNGEKGSIWFPKEWLHVQPRTFCGVEVHAVAPEFQLAMLERPQMLNPDWTCREKDILARECFRRYVEGKGISPVALSEQVSAEEK